MGSKSIFRSSRLSKVDPLFSPLLFKIFSMPEMIPHPNLLVRPNNAVKNAYSKKFAFRGENLRVR